MALIREDGLSFGILQAVCFKKFFAKFFLNLTACHPTRAVWG
ncbi:hypothetical protein ACLS0S_05610 [Glaesserella parasuis]|nr:hypothetical protein [Glaesserella parasuis]